MSVIDDAFSIDRKMLADWTPWLSLEDRKTRRIPACSISLQFTADTQETASLILSMQEFKRLSSDFSGTSTKNLVKRPENGIFFFLPGYDGNVSVATSGSNFWLHSYFRFYIFYWGLMKEADIQLSIYAHRMLGRRLSLRELDREVTRIESAVVYLNSLRKDSSAEAFSDYELERKIYVPLWTIVEGSKLADRLSERLSLVEYIVQTKRNRLSQASNRLIGTLLFLIAILSTSSLSDLFFESLAEGGHLWGMSKLGFEAATIGVSLAAGLIVIFWPRRV